MLHIVATPIGNLGDMTDRAREVLRDADLIACEDTRRTHALMSHFAIPAVGRLISCHEANELRIVPRLIAALQQGQVVAVCTDSGYPGISDPGYRIVSAAIEADIPMDVIPGASAVPVALLMSGLSTASYTFKGYPPRKSGGRIRFFAAESELPHTLVVYESPLRTGKTLAAAFEALGDRRAAVCMELTKKFERVSRGYLGELAELYREKPIKGEVVIVIAGNNPKFVREAHV
ncbi:MAG: 16S rRNA (cytidine(1402)-2'-O)-methyltransferase [Verrucomicrobia bacterium]|nr:16S rRNA (cytidine(1402)-2'-O)-methyltransferase [Verrucomicrobiota bacterium]